MLGARVSIAYLTSPARNRTTSLTAHECFRAGCFGHTTIGFAKVDRAFVRCFVDLELSFHQSRSPRRRNCCAQCRQATLPLWRDTCIPHENRLQEVQNQAMSALQLRSTFVG
jgi:hypothetical protein